MKHLTTKFKDIFSEYAWAEIPTDEIAERCNTIHQQAMKEYADYVLHNEIIDSNNICKCKPDETTGATTWWVCNCCGRIQKI